MWHTNLEHPEVPAASILDKGTWTCLHPSCSRRDAYSTRRLVVDHVKQFYTKVDVEEWYPIRYTIGARKLHRIVHQAEIPNQPLDATA